MVKETTAAELVVQIRYTCYRCRRPGCFFLPTAYSRRKDDPPNEGDFAIVDGLLVYLCGDCTPPKRGRKKRA
jgi:hypothetical protein